jgi:putative hydrolase of the HAD superfamily
MPGPSAVAARLPVSSSGPVVNGLLLDVDDTLMDTRAAMVAAGAAAVAELWPGAGAEVHHAAAVRFHRDPRGYFARFTTGELAFEQMRQARLADLLEFYCLEVVNDVSRRFEQAYAPAFCANVRLFDDALPLVEAAGLAGVPVGLLTNSSSLYTRQKLQITGLTGVFAVVATRDTLGFGKPDARAFHHACELLGSVPAQTVYVGDDVEIDAIAAQAAGLGALWLHRDPCDTRGMPRARAHGIPVVRSLTQVSALLAAGQQARLLRCP